MRARAHGTLTSVMAPAGLPPSRAAGTQYGIAADVLSSQARAPAPAFDPTAIHKLCPTCGQRYAESFANCPADGTRLVAADDLVGMTLSGAYRIVRVLGEGAMARVYEAQHVRMGGKRFAIKALHPEIAGHPDIVARFKREAEAAASIESPHVIGVYDVDRAPDGRAFIVSEFLDGKELGDHLVHIGKMPAGFAVRIVRQLCQALAAAHAKGVIHRDMKPENVFLTGDLARPTAKVLDFGISKLDDRGGASITKTGMVLGTPAFMAPEQARGERVDHRIDIYAVGAILYTLLTGRRPFDREDQAQTLLAVMEEIPPRPRALEPSIPDELELVIQRAMAKSAADRFQTMTQLHDALAPWDSGDPAAPSAGAAGSAPLAGLAARRAPTTLSGTTSLAQGFARPLLVAFAIAGGIWLLVGAASTIGAIVRLSRGGGPRAELTAAESALVYLGLTAALATPFALLYRHVRRSVWDDGYQVMELLPIVRDPVLFGLGAYGFVSLLLRATLSAADLAAPEWDVALGVIGLVATAAAALLRKRPRRASAVRPTLV